MDTDDLFQVPDPIDGPDKQANDQALQQELAKYQKALAEEWEDSQAFAAGKLEGTELREKTQELLTQGIPHAVARMLYLVDHAKNEKVQESAAKWIIERGLGKAAGLVGDPLDELLKGINATADK